MTWTIRKTDRFDPSLRRYVGRYGASEQRLKESVSQFSLFKILNPGRPFPTSADKSSGDGPTDSYVRAVYKKNNVYHCHLDFENADPMIAYRIIPEQKLIVLLAITDHREMFGSDSFVKANQPDLPKSKPRK